MPNFVLGLDGKLYITATPFSGDTPGDVAVTADDLMTNVRDLTINLETGEADITTRDNNGWRATAATLKDGSIEFDAVWKPGDTIFEVVKNAWLGNDEIGVAALDDVIGVGEGPAGNYVVTNFSREEQLEEGMKVSITLKPSSEMQWLDGGSGSGP